MSFKAQGYTEGLNNIVHVTFTFAEFEIKT